MRPNYITSIDKVRQLSKAEREEIRPILDKFDFRTNEYYLNLIQWDDPEDPIRKIIIPNPGELLEYGNWDASDEAANYVVPGCQHKYSTTALLLVSEVCGGYCRFCFRKRLFKKEMEETNPNPLPGIQYINEHQEINNVLLTGGDSLMLSTSRLENIISRLRAIEHVKVIRLGSKLPAYYPMRIYEDKEFLSMIRRYSTPDKRIYIMAHFNHPREITTEAIKGIQALHNAGAVVVNQTPILRGVNDNPEVLAELLNKLSWIGVTPYYFFINRPVAGNHDFVLSLKEVYEIVELAKARTSGLGKRVRLVMSHKSGKIEILAVKDGKAYLKYHQAKNGDYGEFMILDCPDYAAWFDDLPENEKYWKSLVMN